MGGSQLTQLKSALHNAGLSRNNTTSGKKANSNRKAGGKNGKDRVAGEVEARNRKLDSIREAMNRFDVKTTKTKHQIVNQKPTKGATGRPGLSKQVGIENRRKTLLPQFLDRNRSGGVLDRRFGENDASLTPEEKALQRFTLERQRKASKSSLFNLNDDDDASSSPFGNGALGGSGDSDLQLTHFGQNLDSLRGALEDQEDLFKKISGNPRVIPGEGEEDDDGQPQRKKSKAEVMEEIIAKSKAYKQERQRIKSHDEELREQLDDELASIRGLLGGPNIRSQTKVSTIGEKATTSSAQNSSKTSESAATAASIEASGTMVTIVKPSSESGNVDRALLAKLIGKEDDEEEEEEEDDDEGDEDGGSEVGAEEHDDDDAEVALQGLETLATPVKKRRRDELDDLGSGDENDPYDMFVRELAFDKRAAPSDRLKTEAEIAQEAAMELQRAEQKRLKRMRGQADSSDSSDDDDEDGDDERGGGRKKRKDKGKAGSRRLPQGDDLGDDFDFEGDEVSGFGLGDGLKVAGAEAGSEDESEGEDGEDAEMQEGSEDGESDEDDDDEADDEEDTGSEKEENEMLADLMFDEGSDVSGDEDEAGPSSSAQVANSLISTKAKKEDSNKSKPAKAKASKLPYTFPCPADHAEFLDLLEGTSDDDMPIIIQRIRTLHHPSLAEGNKQKLAIFLGVLIDHLIYTTSSPSSASFKHSTTLLTHIFSLSQTYPISSSTHFRNKLTLMQKNLSRGLQAGPLLSSSRTWPGAGELALLRTVGLLWSTSDFSHPVVAPALLLISQYLGQCRVRDLKDVASGLFLCSLVLQYEALSKRLVPEAVNFVAQAVLLLFPVGDRPAEEGEGSELVGRYPAPDAGRAELEDMKIGKTAASDGTSREQEPSTTDLLRVMASSPSSNSQSQGDHIKENLGSLLLSLVGEFATMYNSLPAFIELFEPILNTLERIEAEDLSATLQRRLSGIQDSLRRMLKFSHQARRPLTLQSHKPIPIPTYLPKFDAGYAPGRRFDPDVERNELSKLKALVKKEKKGAIRELRKDSRFIAAEKAKIQKEKDREYKSKIDRIQAGLQQERSEEKRFQRTKEKETLRDKKRAGGGSKGGRR